MSSVAMKEGSEIEACPEGDGFKRAWFRAVLVSFPKKPARKFTVKFLDLVDEDGSSLRETTFQKFMRPIPPVNLFSEDEFEEGSFVEAKHRDGWWVGLFVKKLEDKYLVYFDSPPDLICFKRKQLRQHFEWISVKKWVRPQNKKLMRKKSSFSCGTIVEVMEEKKDVVWVEAIVVKELEDRESFLVKSCKNLSWNEEMQPRRRVGLASIRCVPPLFEVESYMLMEPVEVFMDPGWRPGLVTEILCEKQYKVIITATKEVLVFKHSELRPSAESRSFRGYVQKCTRDNAATTSEMPPSPVENVDATIVEDETAATREPSLAQESVNETAGDVRNESGTLDITVTRTKPMQNGLASESTARKTMESPSSQALGTKVGCSAMNSNTTSLSKCDLAAKDDVPPVTPSPSIASTPKTTLVPIRLQKSSTRENEDKNGKRKRQENITCVANGEETTTTMVLPFQKKLRIWNTFESMEVFKTNPQTPHFSPLSKRRESSREMSAVGMMLTFSGLLEEVTNLQPFDPKSTLESLSDSFTELERHGFNVKTPQSRIHKLMSLKDKQAEKMEEHKRLERGIAEKESQKLENECKILLELQRMNEEANKEIAKMKSSAAMIDQELKDVELQFQSTSRSP